MPVGSHRQHSLRRKRKNVHVHFPRPEPVLMGGRRWHPIPFSCSPLGDLRVNHATRRPMWHHGRGTLRDPDTDPVGRGCGAMWGSQDGRPEPWLLPSGCCLPLTPPLHWDASLHAATAWSEEWKVRTHSLHGGLEPQQLSSPWAGGPSIDAPGCLVRLRR